MPQNTIALVTGANRGLGFATSRILAQQGITVVLGARSPEKGEKAAASLREEGLKAEAVLLDLTRPEHFEAVRQHLADRYDRLDILVNNAGLAHPEEDSLGENTVTGLSAAALKATFEVNFFGPVALTQILLPLLQKSRAGRIVNVSSKLGSLTLHADPRSSYKPFGYDASKTALNQFTIHLATALRDTAIKVNSAHPGWVRTNLGGRNAPMTPEEGAQTAVRLATLGPDGPTGGFFHLDEEIPW